LYVNLFEQLRGITWVGESVSHPHLETNGDADSYQQQVGRQQIPGRLG